MQRIWREYRLRDKEQVGFLYKKLSEKTIRPEGKLERFLLQ